MLRSTRSLSSRQTRSSIGRNGVRQVNLAQRTSTGWFGTLWAKVLEVGYGKELLSFYLTLALRK
ncbi:hypothetical protein [Limnospira platensis]|uniref:hypothetical protein n=1 Tax=Limnospira platensis TaxID=118562 RepID=UPI0013893D3E|nr:hypothetical protein [Arthrospira platensis NCB002]MDF2210942.1 hypothetical protein [Arthrospira platensis NCB002]MDF2212596.1 hypothetical protein [Arthrospira platensis NCB002]MDF2213494.1 hypothetical protein [Arthrospira platensis NCB002]QQW27389.2 hypothetical protein AP9108_19335 [Arthrospira sp. PCC 9108]